MKVTWQHHTPVTFAESLRLRESGSVKPKDRVLNGRVQKSNGSGVTGQQQAGVLPPVVDRRPESALRYQDLDPGWLSDFNRDFEELTGQKRDVAKAMVAGLVGDLFQAIDGGTSNSGKSSFSWKGTKGTFALMARSTPAGLWPDHVFHVATLSGAVIPVDVSGRPATQSDQELNIPAIRFDPPTPR